MVFLNGSYAGQIANFSDFEQGFKIWRKEVWTEYVTTVGKVFSLPKGIASTHTGHVDIVCPD